MQDNLFRGFVLDVQGRKLQTNTVLDTERVLRGDSNAKLLAYDSSGELVFIEQADLPFPEVEEEEEEASSGTIFDILSGNLILDVDQPDLSAGDVTLTVDETQIDHDNLMNFVANEHINHTSVTLTAGEGLSGGGDISANRTFALDITELTEDTSPDEAADFLVTYDTSAGSHKKVKPDNIQPFVTNATGTLPINRGGTGQTTQTAAMDALSPTSAKGDLLVDNGTNVVVKTVGTNGYVLTADSGEATGVKWAPAGGGTAAWVTIVKAGDQSKTSDNTLANDNTLFFTAGADKRYAIRAVIFWTANATPDFQWDFNFSGTTDAYQSSSFRQTGSGTTLLNILGDSTMGAGNTQTATTGNINIFNIWAYLNTGGSGGTFGFQWAQNTSDGNATTVLAGSFLEYLEVTA